MNAFELSVTTAATCIAARERVCAEWESAHQSYMEGIRSYLADAHAPLHRAERLLVDAQAELASRRDQLARSAPSDPLHAFFAERAARAERDLCRVVWIVDGERMHEELRRTQLESLRQQERRVLRELQDAERRAERALTAISAKPF
jgi:hypothetical protein